MGQRTLWIDAQAGLAGDMLCAALLDAGGDLERLLSDLKRLPLEDWSASTTSVWRGPFRALHFDVQLPDLPEPSHRDHSHDHSHSHDHGHNHSHSAHRGWRAIREMLTAAALPERARRRALQVFQVLAEAEGAIHGVPTDEVAFHEVGAVDSIVDTVGACLLLEQLQIDRVVCSPLPLGSGFVRGAHGRMPVPVPATLEVLTRWVSPEGLQGWPTFQDGIPGERVTPTGASLAAGLASCGPMPGMRPLAVGYGAGTRDPAQLANVVRAVIGEEPRPASDTPALVEVLEAQIDDMPGEWIPPLMDALFAAGALDAFAAPVVMKKGRPGLLISALAAPERADAVSDALLRHSTTFGVRRHAARRDVLERRHQLVETPFGEVRIKLGLKDGMVLQASPEFADCAARALEAGVPVRDVYIAASARLKGGE